MPLVIFLFSLASSVSLSFHIDSLLMSVCGLFSLNLWGRVSGLGMKMWKVMLKTHTHKKFSFVPVFCTMHISLSSFTAKFLLQVTVLTISFSKPPTHNITALFSILMSIKPVLSKVVTFLLLDKSVVF